MNPAAHRFSVLDALRGVAALAVCWFHFTNGNPAFLPDGALKSSGSFGWLGVEMFFVISGFIIPYALHRSGYRSADYGVFLLKRVIRLDPPYLVGIFIVIVLGYASTGVHDYSGTPFHPSVTQVLLHLGYVNVFFGQPWLNPVFWTLAIEVQYYLVVGLIFPLVAHRSAAVRAATFASLSALAVLIPTEKFLFHWLFLFMLGMAAFQLRTGIIGRREFFGWIALLGSGAWFVGGTPIAITGVGTALLLGLLETSLRPVWLFFGHISYSLYLLHVPIGGRVINLSQRLSLGTPGKVAVLAAAFGASISAAWLLYRFVELPAREWSSAIRYRRKQDRKSESRIPAPTETTPTPR